MKDDIVADTIEARCIRLVDGSGKPRVSMTASESTDAVPALTVIAILGERGEPRLELQVCGDETGIRISDDTGKIALSVASRRDGCGMAFYDADDQAAILMGVSSEAGQDPDGNVPPPRLEITDRSTGKTWYAQDLLR
ncbi:MAG: hypothetical protein AAGG48_32155 [Planctomycetota bacterium]